MLTCRLKLFQTKGLPSVSDVFYIATNHKSDSISNEYVLWVVGSLERTSEHPLAKAIVKYAEEQLGNILESTPFCHPTEFHAMTGRGASGIISGNVVVAVGNRSFASMMGIAMTEETNSCMTRLEEVGKTAIIAALDGNVCSVLGIVDEVKDDAAASVAYLRDVLGMDVWMVTGDNSRTAAAVSRQIGLPLNRVIAEALPATKLEKVRSLQADEKNVVCMVGDGINDSAALAMADVGMGMGTGADIATEASDIVLVKGHVADVVTACHLSRALYRRIQWNLVLSLIYNCLGIPIAAGVFYPLAHIRLPPTVAAVAMALSSLSVVLSSLTLRFYRPPNVVNRPNTASSRSFTGRIFGLNVENNEEISRALLSDDRLIEAGANQQLL
jgi:P-type Cu+ transporter